MALQEESRSRIIFYTIAALIVVTGGVLFYIVWKDSQLSVAGIVTTGDTNRYHSFLFENTVTSSPVLSELNPIVVPTSTATSTKPGLETEITAEEIKNTPRRNGDPFVPFYFVPGLN
jgi:hypothetical protein